MIDVPTVVRAANEEIIPFLGIATITFSLDILGEFTFEHNFWVAAKENSCRANIIGMDWIQNHCKQYSFVDHTLTMREYPHLTITVEKSNKMPYPYFAKLFQLTCDNIQIEREKGKVVKFTHKDLRYFVRNTELIYSKELLSCGVGLTEVKVNEKINEFPVFMENFKKRKVTLPTNLGYICYSTHSRKEKIGTVPN